MLCNNSIFCARGLLCCINAVVLGSATEALLVCHRVCVANVNFGLCFKTQTLTTEYRANV